MTDLIFLASYLVLWGLVAFAVVGVVGLYYHVAHQQIRSREGRANMGPAIGTPLPQFLLAGTSELRAGDVSATLVGFVSTTCRPCETMMPALTDVMAVRPDVACLLNCQGPDDKAVRVWAGDLPANVRLVYDHEGGIAGKAGIFITPYFLGVNREGVVAAKGLINDRETIERFVEDVAVHEDGPRNMNETVALTAASGH